MQVSFADGSNVEDALRGIIDAKVPKLGGSDKLPQEYAIAETIKIATRTIEAYEPDPASANREEAAEVLYKEIIANVREEGITYGVHNLTEETVASLNQHVKKPLTNALVGATLWSGAGIPEHRTPGEQIVAAGSAAVGKLGSFLKEKVNGIVSWASSLDSAGDVAGDQSLPPSTGQGSASKAAETSPSYPPSQKRGIDKFLESVAAEEARAAGASIKQHGDTNMAHVSSDSFRASAPGQGGAGQTREV